MPTEWDVRAVLPSRRNLAVESEPCIPSCRKTISCKPLCHDCELSFFEGILRNSAQNIRKYLDLFSILNILI